LEEKKLLCALIFPLFFFFISALEAEAACFQNKSCSVSLQEDSLSESSLIESSLKVVEAIQEDKDFQSLLTESSKQRDGVLESKEFQDVVATLKASPLPAQKPLQSSPNKNNHGELTLFVSFSLGEKALLNLAIEAKTYGATLVLRGFKDNSYAQTVKALQKIIQETGQGFIIDPELFSLFSVTSVPTYVLSRPFQLYTSERTQTPIHDRLQGHVSLHYALGTFAKEGDLKNEAQSLLANAQLGGGRSQ
jgi:type-F conjugative transfer system pilin assembly protein TrbC